MYENVFKIEFNNCCFDYIQRHVMINMLQSNEDESEYKSTDTVSEIIFQIVRFSYNQEKIDFISFDLDITLTSSDLHL